MSDPTDHRTTRKEDSRPTKELFSLEKEYTRNINALNRAGILTRLPGSGSAGVIGIDGKEYPVPAQEQLQELFTHNKEIADRKIAQGFTQLQLTPVAMPTSRLIDLVRGALLQLATASEILQTKQDPEEADIPTRVNPDKPLWIWEKIRQVLDTPNLVYFPQVYTERDQQGLTKEDVMRSTSLCAVPGWSVGLVEPMPIMPQPGKGQMLAGRRQLEANSIPDDYLQTLCTPIYQGETGWTPEDFLTHFISRLETTHQVSHDRFDSNALWLLGAYVPSLDAGLARLVLVGYWRRVPGRVEISAHRSRNRLKALVERSMVRLGA